MACVAKTKISVTPGGRDKPDQEHALYLGLGRPVRLEGPNRLELDLRLRYKIIQDDRRDMGPFRVTTLSYQHTLSTSSGEEIVSYQWHPVGQSHETRPHMHVGVSQLSRSAVLTNKAHVMTGRTSVEQVIRTAIELGAAPRCDDWSDRLDDLEAQFVRHRSWH